MPVASSMREFIDAVQTRKTRTMRALDELFGSQAALNRVNGHPNRADLNDPGVFVSGPNGKLPPWAEAQLMGAGPISTTYPLSQVEIDHINEWPADDKEDLRLALVAALGADPPEPLAFYWELFDGDDETIDTGTAGTVAFRTPKSRVRVSGSRIRVDVGRKDGREAKG